MATSKATLAGNVEGAPMTVAQLLAVHPFPAEHDKEKRTERLWTFELPCTPEAIWPHIADTSRMNRILGTAQMTFEERAGKRWGSAKNGGFAHEWWEVPWNWVANQWLTCTRIYERGFMKLMFAIHHVEPIATGTRVYLYFGAIPRGALGAAALRLGFPTLEKAYRRVLPAIGAQLDRLCPEALMLPPPQLTESAEQRLREQRPVMIANGLSNRCIDALFGWIRTGDDVDLHRIQILERARVWQLPEEDLLRVALHATRAGVLALSWDTVCPHCRGTTDEHATLAELAAHSRCDACQVDFTTDTPEAVEVTFKVHASVRDIPDQVYCSAEPSKKAHIRVQWTLPPGGRAKVQAGLEPGRYTVSRNNADSWYLDIEGEGADVVKWEPLPAGTIVTAKPDAVIELVNDAQLPASFSIAQAKWSDHALRAGQLLSFQDFRDLFSEEYIGADVQLAVGEQTLLFTDVVGSTAIYALRGDPVAFIEIKRHFDELFAIVNKHRGAVVKTIGDAVMATFTQPVDALRASLEIHQTFHPARTDTPIRLRISLNTGPCIAVRLNSNVDYFGGTVNIAAKLQAMAEAYQIAIGDTTYHAPGANEFLAENTAELEQLQYTSKALPEPVGVHVWTVYRH